MDQLREEILQAERTRSDLLKWKLGLTGTIGALGLGFSGSSAVRNAELVLVVIPLVCVYVDLLSLHLTLRILVIGTFMRLAKAQAASGDDLVNRYEAFAQTARELDVDEGFVDAARRVWLPRRTVGGTSRARPPRTISAFALEDWALYLSTCVLSLAGIGYGIYAAVRGSHLPAFLFLTSGSIGVSATLIGKVLYEMRCSALSRLPIQQPSSPAESLS